MPDSKISNLPSAAPAQSTDELVVARSGDNYKLTIAEVAASMPSITTDTVNATTGNITTVNATTVDTTNIEVTNIKAKDGTSAITIADSTGVVTVSAAPVMSALTVSQAVFTTAGKALVSNPITGTGNVVMSASPTLTGTVNAAAVTLSGNLTFSSTAQRITGDMNNATIANRLAFQNSVVNQQTAVTALPNGTSPQSQFMAFGASDGVNTNVGVLINTGSEVGIRSNITGTGTYVPLTFYTGGSERVRIDTAGTMSMGTAVGQRMNWYLTGNTKFGVSIASGELRTYAASGNALTFGAMSTIDGTTFSEQMRINSSGNVGIGTASPLSILQVGDGTNAIAMTGTAPLLAVKGASFSTGLIVRRDGYAEAGIQSSSTGNFGTWTSHDVVFTTNATERMRIDTSGNVGIGTTPSKRLHVANNVTNAEFLLSSTANVYADFYLNTWALDRALIRAEAANPGSGSGTGSGALSFWTARNPTMTEAMRIDSSGNVGIGGTANSAIRLDSVGTMPAAATAYNIAARGAASASTTSAFSAFYASPSTVASLAITNISYFNADAAAFGAGATVTNQYGFVVQSNLTGATNNYGFYSNIASGSNRWNFYAAGTAANYFAGNVGIADTGLTNVRLRVKGANTAASDYTIYSENSAATALLFVQNDGKLSTGTAANSPYNLTTASAANVYVDSSGFLYRSTSSLRYKSDVTDATHGLADVLKLRSVTYKGKDGGGTVFGGLIAEEVHDAGLTEFVAYDSEGRPDALHYGNMVALLVKAIQQLTARVATLEAK